MALHSNKLAGRKDNVEPVINNTALASHLNPIDGEPIKLAERKNNDELVINDTALDIIRNIKGKIGVFVVAGPYRQGKSTIMNRLLYRPDGFKIGHTDETCTKGIWMWNKIVKHRKNGNEEINLLFLDTQV